jgi:hypothetical protein
MRLKIAVLCMAGVASAIAQTASTADPSKGVVYVYRLQGGSGPAPNSPSVFCDDQELARMQHGCYFSIRLDPGKHSCRSTDGQSVVELDVKAGEVVPVGGKPRGAITRMSPEQGASEARKLKPLPSGMVKDPNRVLLDPPQ